MKDLLFSSVYPGEAGIGDLNIAKVIRLQESAALLHVINDNNLSV